MSSTLAQLNDRVYLELEMAAEFLQLDTIHNAIIQRHNVRASQSRNSSINVMLGTSAQFTPTTTRHDITSLIGKGIPAWIESYESGEWKPRIRVVSLSQLSDYADIGVQAAAFEAEESATTTTEPIQYLNFTSVPTVPIRIKFDRDSVRIGANEQVLIPDHVVELIVKEVENSIIPRMKVKIDIRSQKDEGLRKIAPGLKQSLSEIYAQNQLEIRELERLWMVWAYRDRDSDRPFTRRTPSGRGMYG